MWRKVKRKGNKLGGGGSAGRNAIMHYAQKSGNTKCSILFMLKGQLYMQDCLLSVFFWSICSIWGPCFWIHGVEKNNPASILGSIQMRIFSIWIRFEEKWWQILKNFSHSSIQRNTVYSGCGELTLSKYCSVDLLNDVVPTVSRTLLGCRF